MSDLSLLPRPVDSVSHRCDDCRGTGADPKKTAAARKTGLCDRRSYICCWTCNGNGLDPAKFFRSNAQG